LLKKGKKATDEERDRLKILQSQYDNIDKLDKKVEKIGDKFNEVSEEIKNINDYIEDIGDGIDELDDGLEPDHFCVFES
jgi:methyl-accepting chemotaxis protein